MEKHLDAPMQTARSAADCTLTTMAEEKVQKIPVSGERLGNILVPAPNDLLLVRQVKPYDFSKLVASFVKASSIIWTLLMSYSYLDNLNIML